MNANSHTTKSGHLNTLLNQLYDLHPKLIDLSLDRMHRLLSDLGNPHHNLPPVIHVAGTNGKGSTVATLHSILQAHGKSCHVATSPHLRRINERIIIAGQEVSDNTLCGYIEECIAINDAQPVTFFEMMMAVTFLAFSRTKADYCLLETGLGGRFDASNVVHDPIACIITTISLDHREFLGDSYAAIASEKAGIMKQGVPCIIGKQTPDGENADIIHTFQSIALSTNAPLYSIGSEWNVTPSRTGFMYEDSSIKYDLPHPSLCGFHQMYNSGAAIAALRCIENLELTHEKISKGLGQIHWPARLQRIETELTQNHIAQGYEIWLDGGHNDSAGQAIAAQIQQWVDGNHEPVHVILGMMARKNPIEFAQPFIHNLTSLTCVEISCDEDTHSPEALCEALSAITSCPITCADTIEQAIKSIKTSAQAGKILICGSLYLAGHVLDLFDA